MLTKIEKHLTSKNIGWFIFISVLFSHLVIALGNENAVLTWFSNDDVFYYFKVAQNVAEGKGFTFDGINLSNGFHPLWMAICIPIFSLAKFNLVLPLRIVIIILGLLHAGAGIFLYKMLQRVLSKPFAILISFSWIYSVFIHSDYIIGGLESGISSFFIILLWERVTHLIQNKTSAAIVSSLWKIGLLAAFTILSRLDNVFIVIMSSIWLWTSIWNNPSNEGEQNWSWRIKTGVAYNLPIIMLVTSYLIWSKYLFGTYMPVSGQVKLWWGSFYDTVYGQSPETFAEFIMAIFSGSGNSGPFHLLSRYLISFGETLMTLLGKNPEKLMVKRFLFMLAAISGITLLVLKGVLKILFNSFNKLGLGYLFVGILLHVSYYKGLGSIGQRSWYWVIENIFLLLFFGVLLHAAWQYLKNIQYIKTIEYGFLLILIIFQLTTFSKHINSRRRIGFENIPHEYIEFARHIQSEFPSRSTIGMTGSGGIGYFTEGYTIINLDGLINSYEYFQKMKEGTAHELLADSGLEYIIGSGYMITESSPYRQIFVGRIEPSQYKFPKGGVWNFIP